MSVPAAEVVLAPRLLALRSPRPLLQRWPRAVASCRPQPSARSSRRWPLRAALCAPLEPLRQSPRPRTLASPRASSWGGPRTSKLPRSASPLRRSSNMRATRPGSEESQVIEQQRDINQRREVARHHSRGEQINHYLRPA